MERRESSLWIMNSAVGMLILIPLLLFFLGLGKILAKREAPKPEVLPDHDQPPIIMLSEAQGYSFASGKADISKEFSAALNERIIPLLKQLAEKYNCNIIEVIGHTDEQHIGGGASNLDSRLLVAGTTRNVKLIAGSNADLGLIRAWSVARHLQDTLRSMRVYGYSAGQCILPAGEIAQPSVWPKDDARRRRIEIRLRRLQH